MLDSNVMEEYCSMHKSDLQVIHDSIFIFVPNQPHSESNGVKDRRQESESHFIPRYFSVLVP
jgi:hypothetical protein